MQPEVFGLNAYTSATVLGYALGVVIGVGLGLRDGRDLRDLLEMGLVVVLSAVLGAKVFHTLFEAAGHRLPDGTTASGLLDLLRADPWHWARLFESGYVFYGGVLGALGLGYLFTRRAGFEHRGSFGDYATPGLALGIFVGRLGCFMAGCCYGSGTDLPWAVQFPSSHPTHGAAVHPVQLYDAAFGLLAFVGASLRYRSRRFPGELFAGLFVSYTIWRFSTELFRADADRGVWWLGMSTSQWVSLVSLPIALFLWWKAAKRGWSHHVEAEVQP